MRPAHIGPRAGLLSRHKPRPDWSSCTRAKLRAELKTRGIVARSKATKAELLEMLNAHTD